MRRSWPTGGCCAKRKKKIHVEHLKSTLQIIFPELRIYNYDLLADYDDLPIEILQKRKTFPLIL
jgi:hypothetical protein